MESDEFLLKPSYFSVCMSPSFLTGLTGVRPRPLGKTRLTNSVSEALVKRSCCHETIKKHFTPTYSEHQWEPKLLAEWGKPHYRKTTIQIIFHWNFFCHFLKMHCPNIEIWILVPLLWELPLGVKKCNKMETCRNL